MTKPCRARTPRANLIATLILTGCSSGSIQSAAVSGSADAGVPRSGALANTRAQLQAGQGGHAAGASVQVAGGTAFPAGSGGRAGRDSVQPHDAGSSLSAADSGTPRTQLDAEMEDSGPSAPAPTEWSTTWATALVQADDKTGRQTFGDVTLRQIVHISIGGSRLRVRISNAFGAGPLHIGAAHLAARDHDAAIVASSDHTLTFSGNTEARIAPGEDAVSDAIDVQVAALADLAISLYLPDQTPGDTLHSEAHQTSYQIAGDMTAATDLSAADKFTQWFFVQDVEVQTTQGTPTVVAFGDSLTDGTHSTDDANRRWPDRLAQRYATAAMPWGVANAGIAGNQVLVDGPGRAATSRFMHDALTPSGVTHVIVFEGVNDLGASGASAQALEDGIRQLIAQAHGRGVKIIGATVTPFGKSDYDSPAHEQERKAYNAWILSTKELDGAIDFDAVVRDPNRPSQLASQYDFSDHIHLNDSGYQALADAVDLEHYR